MKTYYKFLLFTIVAPFCLQGDAPKQEEEPLEDAPQVTKKYSVGTMVGGIMGSIATGLFVGVGGTGLALNATKEGRNTFKRFKGEWEWRRKYPMISKKKQKFDIKNNPYARNNFRGNGMDNDEPIYFNENNDRNRYNGDSYGRRNMKNYGMNAGNNLNIGGAGNTQFQNNGGSNFDETKVMESDGKFKVIRNMNEIKETSKNSDSD